MIPDKSVLDSIDWSASIDSICRKYGLTVHYARIERAKHGVLPRYKRKPPVDWTSVDWKKTNAEIAAEVDRSQSLVSYHRTTQPTYMPATPAQRIDWSKADWKLSNLKLAKQFGCNEETVRQKRILIGVPSGLATHGRVSPQWDLPLEKHPEAIGWIRAASKVGGMNMEEIGEVIGLSRQRIEQIILSALAKLREADVDWDLTAALRKEAQEFPVASVDDGWSY